MRSRATGSLLLLLVPLALLPPPARRADRTAESPEPAGAPDSPDEGSAAAATPQPWPSFRGPNASGVADGQRPPTTWDVPGGTNVLWKTPIPGLGHSCPVVWGDRVFVTTAVGEPDPEFRPGLYGDVDPVKDRSRHAWKVYGLDRPTGRVLWERTAHEGVPAVRRHPKGSHANPTPASDGRHVVASFGSEGLYCYDFQGRLLWKADLGVLPSGWFLDPSYEWGFGSSPVIHPWRGRPAAPLKGTPQAAGLGGLVIVQCDAGKDSFLAAYRLADGRQAWRIPRDEAPSWGTPTVVEGPGGAELVTNAPRYARGYDPLTGRELWRLGRHSDITVPTPVHGQGLIFVTSGYRPIQPIYAIRPGARGDITLRPGETANRSVAWSTTRGGPYLPTPLLYGRYFYTCSNDGILTCYEARTGRHVYRRRLGGAYTASPVAADGKLYLTSEEGRVHVVRAGPRFERLATNALGETCLATPALAAGMIVARTRHHVLGIGGPEAAGTAAD